MAKNRHGLHSPFVYRWYENIADPHKEYYAFNALRELRNDLSRDSGVLKIEDFGAGSSNSNQREKKISTILAHSVKSESSAQRLFKMVDMAAPEIILELGTSLGLTTLYLAKSRPGAKIYTLEGSPEICAVAKKHFERFGAGNVTALEGPFDRILPGLLSQLPKIDFVFLDGNHQFDSTLNYWTMILPKLSEKAVVVVDDIHWSQGMQDAWQEIIKHERVRVSIDLFEMGVLFLDKELSRQEFILKV